MQISYFVHVLKCLSYFIVSPYRTSSLVASTGVQGLGDDAPMGVLIFHFPHTHDCSLLSTTVSRIISGLQNYI